MDGTKRMSYPCCICGKVGLYHVANRNYCGEHKAEAWADRKKTCDAYDKGMKKNPKWHNQADDILRSIGRRLREQRKK